MLSPECFNFQAPGSSFNIVKYEGQVPLNHKIITNSCFNHMVTVVIPDSLRLPETLTQQSLEDCDYYKILNLDLKDLIDTSFLSGFIRNGNVTLLSINSRLDCDNTVAIKPGGQLILKVDKDTYQSLGIEGTISHFTSKIKSQFIISIDLGDGSLLSNETKLCKLKSKLQTLGKFTVIIKWDPPKDNICPSSIAKYFWDLGYVVNTCTPKFKSHTVYSVNVPILNLAEADENEAIDFVEWLGMIAYEGDLSTNDPESYLNSYITQEPTVAYGQVKCLQWRGLFSMSFLERIVAELQVYLSCVEKPWISIYVQGFADAPLTLNNEENDYFTNGDHGYLIIFNKSMGIICTHRSSKKRYN